MPDLGPYFRRQSPTQTLDDAVEIGHSQHLWGGVARNGALRVPSVKAYRGTLPDGTYGIEFFVKVPPSRRWAGHWLWELGTKGVFEVAEDMVGIAVDLIKINQYKE